MESGKIIAAAMMQVNDMEGVKKYPRLSSACLVEFVESPERNTENHIDLLLQNCSVITGLITGCGQKGITSTFWSTQVDFTTCFAYWSGDVSEYLTVFDAKRLTVNALTFAGLLVGT